MIINTISQIIKRFVFCCSICICALIPTQIFSQCIQAGTDVWTESWESCQKTNNPNSNRPNSHWILFEFPTAESITESHIWNANRPGESTKGVQSIAVDYSLDGTNWIFLGNTSVPKASELASYSGIGGPNFGGQFIKKILFTINSTHGNANCASIAEVKFSIDNTACYGSYDECGNCNGPGKVAWYRDQDNDGLGDSKSLLMACTQPIGFVSNADDPCVDVAYGWDIIGGIFKDNGCTGCHGAGESGGLDLRKYETAILGGNKCGTSIISGTNLVGVITIPGYDGCGQSISGNTMNQNVGGAIDAEELATLQAWIDSGALENCDCQPTDPDSDGDGICDANDICPDFNNVFIGTSCNDGNDCTINDTIGTDCNCVGIPSIDTDNDGVCDSQDALPFNPCSADGTIDGIEPYPWTGSESNDCDDDGVLLAQGDFDDFSPCIDNDGYVPSVICECGPSALTAGGLYDRHFGTIGAPFRGGGQPDGVVTNFIGFGDTLAIAFPNMQKGDEICVTLGFADVGGLAVIDMNGLGSYRFQNKTGMIDYELQEFCFETINDGPQTIYIKEDGASGIRVDGSTYSYCPCTVSDPFYNSPDCQCPGNQEETAADYDSHITVGGTPSNAGGAPDGVFTGAVSGTDSLILSFPEVMSYAEICVTVGFSDPAGVLMIEQSNQFYSFQNATGQANNEAQEFCFPAPASIVNNTLILTDIGAGSLRVDGGYMQSCVDCAPGDQDSDNDGICDINDTCPFSQFGDSDGDGVCDDIDICQGFDDNYDSDSDGYPNGCDSCFGFDDDVDTDGDGVPNGCDKCEGHEDALDFDSDGIPNGCDLNPCVNFVTENNNALIVIDKSAHVQVNTNGYVDNNSNFTYSAGHSVLMEKGFQVIQGGTFHAFIAPCQAGVENR